MAASPSFLFLDTFKQFKNCRCLDKIKQGLLFILSFVLVVHFVGFRQFHLKVGYDLSDCFHSSPPFSCVLIVCRGRCSRLERTFC